MSQEKIERWNEVDGNLDNGEWSITADERAA